MINDNLLRNLGDQLGRFISDAGAREDLSLIHISEPTRPY